MVYFSVGGAAVYTNWALDTVFSQMN